MSLKLFQDCTDQELKAIYEQITWGKNMDLGHKLLTHTSRKPGKHIRCLLRTDGVIRKKRFGRSGEKIF